MQLIEGDLWEEIGKAEMILVTTNNRVNRQGELVMGKGAAFQAKTRFPGLARDLGDLVRACVGSDGFYGVLLAPAQEQGTQIGTFQSKRDWWAPSEKALILRSCASLLEMIARYAPQQPRIALNFPGIGFGRLVPEEVFPFLECLPDHVYVYRK